MRAALRRASELLAACALVALLLVAARTTWQPVRVGGESMRPALFAGDLVLVRLGEEPRLGYIALISAAGHAPMLHRVVGENADGSFRTRGDANPVDDIEPALASAVRGRVVAVVPVGRAIERWRRRGRVR